MIRRHSRPAAAIALLYAGSVLGCGGPGRVPAGAGAGVKASALPNLIRGLKSRDPLSRSRSAAAIGRMGPVAKEAVPALIAALKDRNLSVRAASAYALGQIGPDARSAVESLEPLTRQDSLRDVARRAIQQIER